MSIIKWDDVHPKVNVKPHTTMGHFVIAFIRLGTFFHDFIHWAWQPCHHYSHQV